MKVWELMELLSTMDPEAEVKIKKAFRAEELYWETLEERDVSQDSDEVSIG
jgi:hypothetical protein